MRLIDLDEFLRQNCIDRMEGKTCEECKHHVLEVSCERLMEQPAIDPVKEAFEKLMDEDTNGLALFDDRSGKRVDYLKVKHGRWVETKEWGGRNFSCSECRYEFTVDTCMLKPIWNYCPNCGADMRGEEG